MSMNRRYFLGVGLAVASTPVWARRAAATEVRTLSMHHLHTDERMTVAYRVGDNYQRSALKRLNFFLRDFRTGDETAIDPQLFDLLHDVKCRLGHEDGTFEIISGYRSPHTNAMLRRTSSGVARRSLHMVGQAIDVRLTEMPTRNIRDAALMLGRGGVGYYPRSDFVHLDTGRVRRWGA
ncbi:YcbK family protein [Thiohalocapsa sp.]|uniref:YcbK family protein n=1 Tax=Thiohalocapsa sp. TaxID=2497641 RepID=UPI00345BCE3B